MARDRIIIATRESKLALWQAEFIRDELERRHPGLTVELLGMSTAGDRWLQSPLSEVGGKGLFIKELEQALLAGAADIAVHSMKDVPAVMPDGFVLPVIGFRDDIRDAFVSRSGQTLDELPAGSVVGTASLRRQAQVLAHRPDLITRPVRGNVGTRLAKMDGGDYDALLLASAGLDRLGLADRIVERLPVTLCLPAAGQGALGIECRADDDELVALLSALRDPECEALVGTERAVSAGLGADCSAPLGAHAVRLDGHIEVDALLASLDGRQVIRAHASGDDPQRLGRQVAEQLLVQGGEALLQAARELSGQATAPD